MNAKHTPKKLAIHDGGRFGQFADAGPSICAVHDDATCQPLLEFVGPADPLECEANAHRLVAAWNAAHDAGLSTGGLEAGAVKAMVDACEAALAYIGARCSVAADNARETLRAAMKLAKGT